MVCMEQAFQEGWLIISRAGSSGSNNFFAEREAAVPGTIPELAAHVIATCITGEMFFSKIETDGRKLTGRGIGRKDRLQIPVASQGGCIRYFGSSDLGGGGRVRRTRMGGWPLASQQKTQAS